MKFNERAFLIRALVGVFAVQFGTVIYLTYTCQSAIKAIKETDKVARVCESASESFNETGKIALATFLALLVPSSSQLPMEIVNNNNARKKRDPKEEATPEKGVSN